MFDLSARLRNRVQLTSDGHKVYPQAVEDAFGADIGYAMLVKLYEKSEEPDSRYSPPQCIGTSITPITDSRTAGTFPLATSSART